MRRTHASLALAGSLLVAACADRVPTDPSPGAPSLRVDASDPTPTSLSLTKVGGYAGGGVGAAEITAFDRVSKRLFVVNGALGTVDVLDLQNPASPRKIATLSVSGGGANSVAADNGVAAVAIQGSPKTAPGTVAFYRTTTLQLISSVTVGALPDMVLFSPDGRYVLVANEGEPNDLYTTDPMGSVSIIDVTNITQPTVRTAGFTQFNGQADQLRAAGVRLFGYNNPSVAQDLEPEYVAVSEDSRTAWVTLQENNALAIVDIDAGVVTDIVPFGYKDHSLAANKLDASDRDDPDGDGPLTNSITIRNWPVLGMYQPDAIAAYTAGGQTYLVTANEGDARVYPPADIPGGPDEGDIFNEEARVGSLPLNTGIFSSAVCGGTCTGSARLGRLNVTRTLGLNPVTGLYDALYAFGARSFSIWTANGQLVWDSGDQLEQLTAALPMVKFNASNSNNTQDDRSDNKGPEPEGIALGRLGAKTFAFIGLERVGGIVVYDVTTPSSPSYVTYVNTRSGATGDRGPEGVIFVPAVRSPSKHPLVIVGNEVSGTTAVFQVTLH